MITCKEFVLSDVMAITAIPIADFNLSNFAWQLKSTIPADDFMPTLYNAITISTSTSTTDGILIPMRTTGKVVDNENNSVCGRLHLITIDCQIDDRNFSILEDVLILERTPSHLIITYRDKSQSFVAATEDTYLCNIDRDGAKTSIHFRIENYMGIQMLINDD